MGKWRQVERDGEIVKEEDANYTKNNSAYKPSI